MSYRSRVAIIIPHVIAAFTVALTILVGMFASRLHLLDHFGPTFVRTVAALDLALTAAVEIPALGLKKQKSWARMLALCIGSLYALVVLLTLGMVSLWGRGDTIARFCKTAKIDCKLALVPMAIDEVPTFNVQIGDHVAPGKPSHGAGRIEKPGTIHRYMFTVDPGTALVLKAESPCTIGAAHYELHNVGNLVPSQTIGENSLCAGMERNVLKKGGLYSLLVSAEEAGEYAFVLQRLTDDNQSFTIKIGDHVAPDKPRAGAGRIEKPGSHDRYTFTAEAGSRVSVTAEPPCSDDFNFRMAESTADDHFIHPYILNCRTTRNFYITHRGTYIIPVAGYADAMGDYGFVLQTAGR